MKPLHQPPSTESKNMASEYDPQMQKIAQKILNNMDPIDQEDTENYGFVITVLMIISITLTLIRIIQECNKNKIGLFSAQEKYSYFGEEIKNLSIKKTWFTKMMIKKAIRKELPKEQYKIYGVALMNAILKTGENLNHNEIVTLVEASNV